VDGGEELQETRRTRNLLQWAEEETSDNVGSRSTSSGRSVKNGTLLGEERGLFTLYRDNQTILEKRARELRSQKEHKGKIFYRSLGGWGGTFSRSPRAPTKRFKLRRYGGTNFGKGGRTLCLGENKRKREVHRHAGCKENWFRKVGGWAVFRDRKTQQERIERVNSPSNQSTFSSSLRGEEDERRDSRTRIKVLWRPGPQAAEKGYYKTTAVESRKKGFVWD